MSMGIYLPNMEMPKEDSWITVRIYPDGTCAVPNWQGDCTLIKGTKAVTVPPHGRLGDLDRLEQMFVDIDNAPYSGFDGTEPFYSAEDAALIIRLAPTIIPACEEVYDKYTDTAGNLHWTGTHSGKHIISAEEGE